AAGTPTGRRAAPRPSGVPAASHDPRSTTRTCATTRATASLRWTPATASPDAASGLSPDAGGRSSTGGPAGAADVDATVVSSSPHADGAAACGSRGRRPSRSARTPLGDPRDTWWGAGLVPPGRVVLDDAQSSDGAGARRAATGPVGTTERGGGRLQPAERGGGTPPHRFLPLRRRARRTPRRKVPPRPISPRRRYRARCRLRRAAAVASGSGEPGGPSAWRTEGQRGPWLGG